MFFRLLVLSLLFLAPVCVSENCLFAALAAEGTKIDDDKGNKKPESEINKLVYVSGNVGFLSNYVYRGQTQTFGGAAVQGQLIFRQREEDGVYLAFFGSNVDSTTATNGSGMELDIETGYIYKPTKDLALKLELLYTYYPGAYAPLETRDSFNVFEIYPTITYKYFTVFWAYSFTNVRGINQNFVQAFLTPLAPNGNSKGSWYAEANMKLPIPGTENKFNFLLSVGYQRVKNYHILNYTVFGTGFSYTLPERWAGLTLSVNASSTTARKDYYTVANQSEKLKNLAAKKIWVGITKEF